MGLGIQTLSPLLLGGDQERAERRGVTWSWARKDFEVVTLLSRGVTWGGLTVQNHYHAC